jgi:hypothetical protein
MLGKSAGTGVFGLCMLLALSCAHNVAQDAATGADGKTKGAKNITLDNNEGKSNGIVTYPGGDRVDWKVVQLPEKESGSLDLELKWTPPRPGLQLNFDVFDEWYQPIVQSKKMGKGKKGRVRTATVEKGPMNTKYFIRVYAVSRGDAGKYKLTLEYHPGGGGPDWTKIDVPDPPRLAAVPVEVEPCDDTNFDPKKPECKMFCPAAAPPPGWPACKGKCPDPPDPQNQACWDKVCPTPATTDSKACLKDPKRYFPPCPPPGLPDPANPNCPKTREALTARVQNIQVQGNEVLVTIPRGSDQGVTTDWKGTLLRSGSNDPLPGGDITIVRVAAKQTLGKVQLTPDQVNANQNCKLIPPK